MKLLNFAMRPKVLIEANSIKSKNIFSLIRQKLNVYKSRKVV